ncbi:MAG TPA: enoyl-CoA hydratase/isomerase family protein [Alphaproteobacteria bacterium]|jgi:2-oxoglutaroyl-CoA hydrolase|nr:MAG: Carnitinyl-CoA dehydratase [Alphaproteobacteria bacterium MarineAlpha9_Bin6]PPR40105.1 MAG: Carnitinyl-CoA dehydratase [Alphaproteobacteria bacterium MarineAlpha9_Bin5]HHZ67635.1 enoyl-CoA hydratase/isomerase family protein [Alphaproteobacteria bacterium]HIB18709.1 enoyl-CoA hydratase/isomerase family protein [Alphaproteobacteria bacterium]HIB55783.1 enoyl-CoA hydratase/isomerase family protein [Alphaproteobacteria bacterium]
MSQSPENKKIDLLGEMDGFRVEVNRDAARGDIILDRPPLNIIRMPQRDQMSAAFAALDCDDRVRVIVLRGAGENFSSGGEIKGFLESSPEHVSSLAKNVMAPERCHKPVVAAIQGYCFGVGFEFCLACDFRIVTETAFVGLPEQRIGMIPGSGGSIRLLHMIGLQRTKDIVMRSRRISGPQAYDWGIALDCVAFNSLDAAVVSLVKELSELSPLAQRTSKRVLNGAQDAPLHVGIELEGQAYGRLRSSHDFREGVESFHEKRKADFDGT